MELLSSHRFAALAGYARSPRTFIDSVELEWYSEEQEQVLAVLIQDTYDRDYSCVIMGRDALGRYRAVEVLEMVLEAALNGGADAPVTYNVADFAAASRRFSIAVIRPRIC